MEGGFVDARTGSIWHMRTGTASLITMILLTSMPQRRNETPDDKALPISSIPKYLRY